MRCRKTITGLVLALALTTLALCAAPTGATSRPDGRREGSRDGSSPDGASAPGGSWAAPGRGWSASDRGRAAAAEVSTFRGWAFDTCHAPPLGTMRRWESSDYRAVGVYFGGRGRACKRQAHLSRDWMRAVQGMGWRVLPLYVGSQSPCVIADSKQDVRIGQDAWREGTSEGRDAVSRAKALGMQRDSPLYLDMEAYGYRNEECARTTLAFVRAWDREVRRLGYVPGFYSSADSGVRHMETARRAGVRDLPEVMWFARWRTSPDLYREPVLRRDAWHPARRIHQFAGNVKERHGGRTLLIDRSLVHAPVAQVR
ncbi:DUF1906 domain-containing protein [Streptomyces sp. MZ04]|uniref:DUF1906 domain-containing protein n=1 Tax=Streptomyces sp. MZ04 TaxID=2559236 RepID=UPI00107EC849|nr:DUF1906 domain-containing protein [Streptomyces sp. MZ04]TGA98071.1 DUF1906 domain-containing protein [Streptomyces sp. MZ04]